MYKICYFCDNHVFNENGHTLEPNIWICYMCNFFLPLNNKENGECCVCFEKTTLHKLPCHHTLCIKCCKTIYFGTTQDKMPMYWAEVENPDYPYELNDDDDNDPERLRFNEYDDFEDAHFDYEKTYDELIEIRNSLIMKRPEWMNTEQFLTYETKKIRYYTECIKLEKEWDLYEQSKTKGNKKCPLCRS